MVCTERRGSVKAVAVLTIFLIALSAMGVFVFKEPLLKFLYLAGPGEYEMTQPIPEGNGTNQSPARQAKEGVPESTAPPTTAKTPVPASPLPAVVKPTPTQIYPPAIPAPTLKITPTPTPILTLMTQNKLLLSGILCTVDYQLIPQSEGVARRLLDLCESNVPKIEAKFGRGLNAPPYRIEFYTPGPGSGGQGTNSDSDAYVTDRVYLGTNYWQTEHSNDAGILTHELTHVIQSYQGYLTSAQRWLVEALADYGAYVAGYSDDLETRCYHFSTDMQNQTHMYSCTYKFLKFVGGKYDSEIPFKLHRALQSGTYSDNLWIQYTGKAFSQLASECSQDSNCGGAYHGGL